MTHAQLYAKLYYHQRGRHSYKLVTTQEGHFQVIQLLVQQGFDKNEAKSDGCAPPLSAARSDHLSEGHYCTWCCKELTRIYPPTKGATYLINAELFVRIVQSV